MAENDLVNELPKIDIRCDIKRQAFNPFSLDAINFLLADVRGALGLTLNVFLVTQRHWSQTEVIAVLYTFSDNSFWLIGVQVLDGVGAGIFGALTPLVIADIMRGTGRYNLAQGAIATMQGIGASLSGLAAGVIVDHLGYSAAFLTLGAAAGVALIVFALGMPETAEPETVSRLS